MSTLRVPSVEARCQKVAFVHAEGAQRGSSVPGATFRVPVGDFCPQAGAFLWTRRENVAACPHRRCFLWKFGARRRLLSTLRVPSVEARCQQRAFVHKKGPFRGGMGLQVFVWKGEIVGKRIFLLPLFANHNIQNHFVCGLHPFCSNAAEVADCLFYAIFYDTVV